MIKAFRVLMVLFSCAALMPISPARAVDASALSELRCYREAAPRIQRLGDAIILFRINQYAEEGKLLDEIFDPELYQDDANLPLVASKKNSLLALREKSAAQAAELQRDLEKNLEALSHCAREAAGKTKYMKTETKDLECFKSHFPELSRLQLEAIGVARTFAEGEKTYLDLIFDPTDDALVSRIEALRQVRSDFVKNLDAKLQELEKRSSRFDECRKESGKGSLGVMAAVPESAISGSAAKPWSHVEEPLRMVSNESVISSGSALR